MAIRLEAITIRLGWQMIRKLLEGFGLTIPPCKVVPHMRAEGGLPTSLSVVGSRWRSAYLFPSTCRSCSCQAIQKGPLPLRFGEGHLLSRPSGRLFDSTFSDTAGRVQEQVECAFKKSE